MAAAPLPRDDESLPLLKALLLQSPPHRLWKVLECCEDLVKPYSLPETFVEAVTQEVNERNLLPLNLGNGRVSIVSDLGRVGQSPTSTYLSLADGGLSFQVHHATQSFIPDSMSLSPDCVLELLRHDAEPYRAAVERELTAHLRMHYPTASEKGAAGALVACRGIAKGLGLDVVVSSTHNRETGFWAGAWRSRWSVDLFPESMESCVLLGELWFSTQYYEHGNVQFRRRANMTKRVKGSLDAEQMGRALVRAISDMESEFHLSTDESLQSLAERQLRALRRVLPIQKERFDWRPFRHTLARDMRRAVGEHVHR